MLSLVKQGLKTQGRLGPAHPNHCAFCLQFVGAKVAYALEQGLKVIPCVGETLEQRESGKTMDVITDQLKAIAGMDIEQYGICSAVQGEASSCRLSKESLKA
jgi:hypothetical protein